MKLKHLVPFLAFGLIGIYSEASAAIVDLTFRGIVSSDFDQTGIFGPAGGSNNLIGDLYTGRYVFNTALGSLTSSSDTNLLDGGTNFGSTSPLVSATATINGHTVNMGGDFESFLQAFNNGSNSSWFASAFSQTNTGSVTTSTGVKNSISTLTNVLPLSLTASFTYNVGPNDNATGSVSFSASDNSLNTAVDANLTSLTAGVPETSTWAMMLLGFAGIGFARYRSLCKSRIVSFAA